MRKDYSLRREALEAAIGSPLQNWVRQKYEAELWSADQLAEHFGTLGFVFTSRSILRWLHAWDIPVRTETFYQNAMKTGRMHWALKDPALKSKAKQVQGGLRFMILKRDGFRCVLCGATSSSTVLEIDHIKSRANGGTNDPANLRVLCHECNCGKRVHEKEK